MKICAKEIGAYVNGDNSELMYIAYIIIYLFIFLLSQQPHATITTTTVRDLLLAPSTHSCFQKNEFVHPQ